MDDVHPSGADDLHPSAEMLRLALRLHWKHHSRPLLAAKLSPAEIQMIRIQWKDWVCEQAAEVAVE